MRGFPIEIGKKGSCIPLIAAVIDWFYFTFTHGIWRFICGALIAGFAVYHSGLYLNILQTPLNFYPSWLLMGVGVVCLMGVSARFLSSRVESSLLHEHYKENAGVIWYLLGFSSLVAFHFYNINQWITTYYGWSLFFEFSPQTFALLSHFSTDFALFLFSYFALIKPCINALCVLYVAKNGCDRPVPTQKMDSDSLAVNWQEIRERKLETFSGNRRPIVSGKVRFDSTKFCDVEAAEQFMWDFLQLNPKSTSLSITPPTSDRLGLTESYIVHVTEAALEFGFEPKSISFAGTEHVSRKQARRLSEDVIEKYLARLADAAQDKIKLEEAKQQRSDELESMIGLYHVKEEVRRMNAMLTYNQQRQAEGLSLIEQGSYHMVFTGNPGTGKTVVARLIAQMLADKGVIKESKVIEVTRSDLVGRYVGHTAPKVREVVESAMGGVLFIDEAYTLCAGGSNDFGQEAIDELLKLMEDRRGDFVIIVAGYKHKMEEFLQSNDGLKRRFARFIHFDDYSNEELTEIFTSMAVKSGDVIEADLLAQLPELIAIWRQNYRVGFGNAGSVRQLLEAMQKSRPLRLIEDNIEMKGDALVTLTRKDWDSAIAITTFVQSDELVGA